MNSSFSRRRFGVIRRMSSARCAVWIGGSNVSSWSLIGSSLTVLLDERGDVVALERHGEPGEGPGRRVARRERVGVVVHRDRFVVPGHHHHAVMGFAPHRALPAQPLEVRVRVGDELVASEEVDRVVVGHRAISIAGVVPVGPIGSAAWTSRSPSRNATLSRLCREFAQKEIAARAPAAWEEARCPTDLLREMGALGLLGMLIPERWGGIGMSTVGFVAAMEQIGLADQSVAAAWQAHVTIGSLPLYLFGSDAQRERWLRPLGRGTRPRRVRFDRARRRFRRAAASERGRVRRDGGWLINGRKAFISNAGTDMSFGVTLLARTESGEDPAPDVRELRRREGHRRLHDGPEDARHRLARSRHPRAVLRRRLGRRRSSRRRSRRWGSASSCARSRSGASRSPRCRSA